MTEILILVPASSVLGLQMCTTTCLCASGVVGVHTCLCGPGAAVCTTHVYVVLGLEPKAKHTLGKCSTTWASSPACGRAFVISAPWDPKAARTYLPGPGCREEAA